MSTSFPKKLILRSFCETTGFLFLVKSFGCLLAMAKETLYSDEKDRTGYPFSVSMSLPACSYLPLPLFEGFDLVALFLVRGQSEACDFTFISEDLPGMEPPATLRASVDSVPIGNRVFLITPIIDHFDFIVRRISSACSAVR
jgi:hypothetical protein